MADPELPLTPRAKRTLLVAERIARDHGHAYIGTEHVMLAMLADPDGIGGGTIHRLGSAEAARAEIERVLESDGYAGGPEHSA